MEQLGDPGLWSKFGLSGLVIFALFVIIGYLLNKIFSQSTDFMTCIKEVSKNQEDSHKETLEVLNALKLAIEKMSWNCGSSLKK
jgi:hypothetical protein